MDITQQIKTLQDEAKTIAQKAQNESRDFSDEELSRIGEIDTETEQLKERKVKSEKSAAMLAKLTETDETQPVEAQSEGKSLGDRFVKSNQYQEFAKTYPSGVGSGSPVSIGRAKVGTMSEWFTQQKAPVGADIALPQPERRPTIDLVERPRLTLLDLISRGQMSGNSFEYIQITGVNRNAGIVPDEILPGDSTLKPESDFTTQLADAKAYTYADGATVTNMLLADAPAFASFMENEFRYSLDMVIADKLLNGTGTNGEPKGLLNTTGVQQQGYANGGAGVDKAKAVRQAITKVTRLGGQVTGIVMAPEDDEELDLMQDANQRFYGQGPFGAGPATLWGRPRVTSEQVPPGTFILGDFRQIMLLDREGLSVLAFNQHKDYAQRNLVYVRAELRAAQVIWRPNRLCVVTEDAAA